MENISTKVYTIERKNQYNYPFNNLRCLRKDINSFHLFARQMCNKLIHRYPEFLFWLYKDAPDLVHAHFGLDGYYILPYTKCLGIPLITSFYGYDAYLLPHTRPHWRNIYKKLFKQGRLFLAEGPAMYKKLIDLGCPSNKIVIHHIGIKLEKYKFHARKPDNEIRLLVCGRFVEKKGIPYAVKALKQVISKIKSDIRLTIVGDSNDNGTMTDEKRKILHTICEHGIDNDVTITGFVSHNELMKVIYKHHILLAPSIHASNGDAEGGFPVILTEALATGMPILAFNHCDIPSIVQDGVSGFVVPERNVDAFVEKLIYLIKHPEIWPKMGKAGRDYIAANYNIDKLNGRLVEIYQKLLYDK